MSIAKINSDEVKCVGTLLKVMANQITVEVLPNAKRVNILMGHNKKFNLEIGEMYEFVCYRDSDDGVSLWLSHRVKVIIWDRAHTMKYVKQNIGREFLSKIMEQIGDIPEVRKRLQKIKEILGVEE
jgi:hypothetical protein